MLDALVDNIALRFFFRKLVCRELTCWIFAAIDAATGKQTGEFRDGNAIELTREDMFQTFFKVGNLWFQSFDKSLSYLSQKHAALATRVEECGVGVLKQLLWKHVDNLVCQFGRCEYLVVAQVGYARQYVGVVDCVEQVIFHNIMYVYFHSL